MDQYGGKESSLSDDSPTVSSPGYLKSKMNTTKVGLNIREIREGKETLRWGSVAEESYQVYGT